MKYQPLKIIIRLTFFLVILLTTSVSVQGQSFSGTYKHKDEYFRFENDSIYFRLFCCGGILYEYEASGTYKIQRNKIIIEPNVSVPRIKILKQKREIEKPLVFLIKDVDTLKNQTSLILFDKNKKIISAQQFISNQKILIKQLVANKIDSIFINKSGYIPVTLKIDNNFNYEIEMVEGKDENSYRNFLNTEKGGLKFKERKNAIVLYIPRHFKKGDKYYEVTLEK
jgi:hypothetical protein